MSSENEAVRKLGVRHPIIQGPFGGGLSTARLTAIVSNMGGLGSYGAHVLSPDQIGPIAQEIRSLTSQPFASNLWVSDHDHGGQHLSQADFNRVWRIFEPYYHELGVARPKLPERFHHRFEDQVEALIAANPPAFSFVFGIPAAPIQNWFVSNLRPAAVAAGRTDLVSLWSGQVAPNLRHRPATALMDALVSDL